MAIKGCSPHQIQGYAVTGLPACGNFFFNFLELKGYEVTKVTKVTGVTMVIKFKITKLQGYQRVELFFFTFLELKGYEVTQVTEVTQMFFFKNKTFFPRLRGYRVTKVTRLRDCKILHIS